MFYFSSEKCTRRPVLRKRGRRALLPRQASSVLRLAWKAEGERMLRSPKAVLRRSFVYCVANPFPNRETCEGMFCYTARRHTRRARKDPSAVRYVGDVSRISITWAGMLWFTRARSHTSVMSAGCLSEDSTVWGSIIKACIWGHLFTFLENRGATVLQGFCRTYDPYLSYSWLQLVSFLGKLLTWQQWEKKEKIAYGMNWNNLNVFRYIHTYILYFLKHVSYYIELFIFCTWFFSWPLCIFTFITK
jgi:hypothetical protein